MFHRNSAHSKVTKCRTVHAQLTAFIFVQSSTYECKYYKNDTQRTVWFDDNCRKCKNSCYSRKRIFVANPTAENRTMFLNACSIFL